MSMQNLAVVVQGVRERFSGFCILGHRYPLTAQVSMFVLCGPGARLQGNGERERRTGTKLMAVFLQHIGSEVNTPKGVVSWFNHY